MTRKPRALPWLWLSAALMALDQLSKQWAMNALSPGVPQPVIPGFLSWTLTFNSGVAFSFLAGSGYWQHTFLVVLVMVIIIMLALLLGRTARRDWCSALPLTLMIGGAAGNLIDRLHAARVTDFIAVYYRSWHFPVFNLADIIITLGMVNMLLCSLFKRTGHPTDD